MKTLTRVALFALFLLALGAPAQATPITYQAFLSGPNEFPANASPGTGYALVTFDDVAHTLAVSATFSGLLSTTTASHIHCCVSPSAAIPTAGVATTTPSFVGFPLGVTSGTFSNVYDMTLASTFRAGFITANGGTVAGAEAALGLGLANGEAYFNIHTTLFPGGEIRGFLTPVPEPATLTLLGFGLGAAALRRRLRKTT